MKTTAVCVLFLLSRFSTIILRFYSHEKLLLGQEINPVVDLLARVSVVLPLLVGALLIEGLFQEGRSTVEMIEDDDEREAREAQKQEKALRKLSKLAAALKMDVLDLQAMDLNAKAARHDLNMSSGAKDITWRRRGIMKTEVEKMVIAFSYQKLIGKESISNLDLRVSCNTSPGPAPFPNFTLTPIDEPRLCWGRGGAREGAARLSNADTAGSRRVLAWRLRGRGVRRPCLIALF